MGERGGRLAADNGRGLVYEVVVLKSRHHEQGKVHAAREIALEDGVADVTTLHRHTLARAIGSALHLNGAV